MWKTSQANVIVFQITEVSVAGHNKPKNPEHRENCWFPYLPFAMYLLGNQNKNIRKFLASNTAINMQIYHWHNLSNTAYHYANYLSIVSKL